MKRFSLIAILIFCCIFSNAQDTILKRNGDRVCAKIMEVSTTEVKYKKFDFLEGPTYVESTSNIQLIKYSNGSMEEFRSQQTKSNDMPRESTGDYYTGSVTTNNKIERYGSRFRFQGEAISERKLHGVLFNSKDKQIVSLTGNAKDAKGLQYIGFGAIPFGIGALFFLTRGMGNYYYSGPSSSDLTFSAICLVGAISCPIASGIFKHKRNVSNREAIKLYNERF